MRIFASVIVSFLLFLVLWVLVAAFIILTLSSHSAGEALRNTLVTILAWSVSPGLAAYSGLRISARLVKPHDPNRMATAFMVIAAILLVLLFGLSLLFEVSGVSDNVLPVGLKIIAGVQMFSVLFGAWLAKQHLKDH